MDQVSACPSFCQMCRLFSSWIPRAHWIRRMDLKFCFLCAPTNCETCCASTMDQECPLREDSGNCVNRRQICQEGMGPPMWWKRPFGRGETSVQATLPKHHGTTHLVESTVSSRRNVRVCPVVRFIEAKRPFLLSKRHTQVGPWGGASIYIYIYIFEVHCVM